VRASGTRSGAASARRRNGKGGARLGHVRAYMAAGNTWVVASRGGCYPYGVGVWSGCGGLNGALTAGPARFEKFSNF
jgi:hypothetical protein